MPLAPSYASYLTAPIPTCLRPELPIMFHGQYDSYRDPDKAIIPALAAPIDVLTDGCPINQIDEIRSNYVITGVPTGTAWAKVILNSAHGILSGEGCNLYEDWRLYRVEFGKVSMTLWFFERTLGVTGGFSFMYPHAPLKLTFRIIPPHGIPVHKLYFCLTPERHYGRIVQVAEWRRGQPVAMFTTYLDASQIILDDIFSTGVAAMEALPATSQSRRS